MAVTKLNNIINPEVMGDMIEAKITAMAKFTPYAKIDTALMGVPGDTKTVPSWNYIGDAEDVAEGAEVDLTSMSATSTTFEVKKATFQSTPPVRGATVKIDKYVFPGLYKLFLFYKKPFVLFLRELIH